MAPDEPVAPNELASRHTLWLSIRLGRENWLFEIEPDEERAIVVGSLLRAHIRINRREIAPVHFHFEREHDCIRLCPAYGADLCVNGTRISGPYELEAHATIAFAGLELEAYVCDIEPNILEQLDLRNWTAEELPDCGAVLSLPDVAEVTRAVQRLSIAPEPPADATKKYAPLCDSYLQRGADSAERCEPTLPGARALERSVAADAPKPQHEPTIDNFPSTAPVCSDASGELNKPKPVFARIGLVARERPVTAALATLVGAALLSLAMLAVDGILFPEAREGSPRELHVSTSPSAAVELPAVTEPSPDSLPPSHEAESTVAPAASASAAIRQAKRETAASTARAKRPVHPSLSVSHATETRPNVSSGL